MIYSINKQSLLEEAIKIENKTQLNSKEQLKKQVRNSGSVQNKQWVKKYSPVFAGRMIIPSAIGAGIGYVLDTPDEGLDGTMIGAGVGLIPGIIQNTSSVKYRIREQKQMGKNQYRSLLKDAQ